MASSLNLIAGSEPPFQATSSPTLPSFSTTRIRDHTDIDIESEPASTPTPASRTTAWPELSQTTFDFTSDCIEVSHLSPSGIAASGKDAPSLNRKRGPPARDQGQEPRTKDSRTQEHPKEHPKDQEPSSLARTKILEARNLLLEACTLSKSYEEQSRLLDLLEVFREYTKKGKIFKTLNIIASQVASLKTATRNFENKTKTLASNPSFAKAASLGTTTTSSIATPQEWTLATKAKPQKQASTTPTRPKKSTRLILVKSPIGQTTKFSSLALRNAFNKAFVDKGVIGPVVNAVSTTLNQNIVVTTAPIFSADFLLEKQSI